jgi:hypothetical protein
MTKRDDITERAIESVVRQFKGGEHVLAGRRASELVYGARKTPDEGLIAELADRAPGIERYISAPEAPVTMVSDQSGDPAATQPENQPEPSNVSDDQANQERDEIDERLKAGRQRGQKAGADKETGSTKLNPDSKGK